VLKRFFDFLFYGIYLEYAKKEKGAVSSSATIVGGLWFMNLAVILMISGDIMVFERKILIVVLVVLFQIITYFLYGRKDQTSIDMIPEKWTVIPANRKVLLRALIVIYIAASILSFFGLAIYIGSQ
jgi:hypothetical protein